MAPSSVADTRLRGKARTAFHGGPREKADLLRERLRLGDLTQDRLELAAYVGDPAAQILLRGPYGVGYTVLSINGGRQWIGDDNVITLETWADDLAHWTLDVSVRAAMAIGRAAVLECSMRDDELLHVLDTLDSVAAWLAYPCEEIREVCGSLFDLPLWALASRIVYWGLSGDPAGDLVRAARSATPLLGGEEAVRDVVSQALVSWSLS